LDKDMAFGTATCRHSDQFDQGIAGFAGICIRAWLIGEARPVHFSCGNACQANTRTFLAPDRPIAIPDARRSAGEGLASRNDGDSGKEREDHLPR